MAEPGDPDAPTPTDPAVDHDDLIGFSSAAALQGRSRVVQEPEPDPVPEPAPSVEPVEAAASGPEADPVAAIEPAPPPDEPVLPAPDPRPRPRREVPPGREPAPTFAPAPRPAPVPGWAVESPRVFGSSPVDRRTVVPPKDVAGSTGLYTVYALILFAVPTLGVSALIALLAVTGRPGPGGAVAASHFLFQQRTLWTGAVAALLGAILIAVGLGVFVLFIVAVWLILRGASGVLTLKAGRPVRNPRGWFLA
ncbi:hypothetical protein [Brevundimonas sp. AJA228-03]|uniref:DUF4870 family protein n=1 Tax=Brevundimonas sp. AJA228-03 TaxID=2752515 RepID=UPI001FD7F133|nr:hypothetical protein [Brevundimonas sp. AJA228-03]